MPFACLYIPDFMIQANLRADPGALGQAVALVEGAFPRVVAMTSAAREAGVALGMTKAQAAQFASIRYRSQSQEDSTHAALVDCAKSCSPRVEDTAPDTATIDLEGLEKLLGPPSAIAARLLGQAEELGVTVRVAIAANPDTAILAARGFHGVTLIPCGEEAKKLGELPASVLNPEPEMLDTFDRWGVHRLKELAELPPLPLSERLGQEGIRLQELARGKRFRSLVISREEERFEEAWELENPVTTLDELDFVLSSLLTRISKRLAIRSLAVERLRLRLNLVGGAEPEPTLALEERSHGTVCVPWVSTLKSPRHKLRAMATPLVPGLSPLAYDRTISFPTPINNARLFFKLWRLRLESDLPGAPVSKASITAKPARPRALQGGLFTPLAPDPEKLELTLARIAAVVGKDFAGSPELVDTHRPYAFRMAAFNPVSASKTPSILKSEVANRKSQIENPKFQTQNSKWNTSSGALAYLKPKDGFGTIGSPNLKFEIKAVKFSKQRPTIRTRISEIQNPKSKIQNGMSLRLFRPPVPATVELSSGRPAALSSQAVRGRIIFAAGPWRKSGGWWEEEKWDCEEWDVEIRPGKTAGLYSIYYDLAADQWYVQGEYD